VGPASGSTIVAQWGQDPSGSWWDPGTYTITAACRLTGYANASASTTVQILG